MDTPAILKVRIYPDPCLRKKSQDVKKIGPKEKSFIKEMLATMYNYKGIGLAAPQVGVNEKIFVVDIGRGPHVFLNPKVSKKQGSKIQEEGCLSLPGIHVEVKRPFKILVKYMDENNQDIEKEFEDLMARVILHETEHLDGKLILDYTTKTQREKLIKQMQESLNLPN